MEEDKHLHAHIGNGRVDKSGVDDDPYYPNPGHCRMDRRRTSYAYRAVMAVDNVARRISVPTFTMTTIAQDLDEEIERESEEPDGMFQVLRRAGEKILHSKKVLLLVVVLNIIDCALVLAELILDIHFIKDMLYGARGLIMKLTGILMEHFPAIFEGIKSNDVDKMFNRLIESLFTYNQTAMPTINYITNMTELGRHRRSAAVGTADDGSYFSSSDIPVFLEKSHGHSLIEDLAHAFHKVSVIILGILLLMVILKIFCYGFTLIKKKMELFDGFIVLVSFLIDIAFIKGLMGYPLEDAVSILAFLVPWRVIRVANSLVMAVMDEAHLQLKMVYTEKKNIETKLEDMESRLRYQKEVNNIMRQMCLDEGIPMSKISDKVSTACDNQLKITRKKKIHFSGLKKKLKGILNTENCIPQDCEVKSFSSWDEINTPPQDNLSRQSSTLYLPAVTLGITPEVEEGKESLDLVVEQNDSLVDNNQNQEQTSPHHYRKAHHHIHGQRFH